MQELLAGRRVLASIEIDRSRGVHPVRLDDDLVLLDRDRGRDRIKRGGRQSDRDAVLLRRRLRVGHLLGDASSPHRFSQLAGRAHVGPNELIGENHVPSMLVATASVLTS